MHVLTTDGHIRIYIYACAGASVSHAARVRWLVGRRKFSLGMDEIVRRKSATEQTALQVGPGESLQQGSSGPTLQQGGAGAPFSMEQTAWLCEFLAKERARSPERAETSRNGEFGKAGPGRTGIFVMGLDSRGLVW